MSIDDEPVDTSPMQPFGEFCIVICRISSNKKEFDKAAGKPTIEAYNARRVAEGIEIGRRLAANCPQPFQFREIYATCHKRGSTEPSDWCTTKTKRAAMVQEHQDWFKNHQGGRVTVVIRAPDGLTILRKSFHTFLKMIEGFNIEAQIVFQYNKVCDEIRPHHMRNFLGLGGTVDFMANNLLAHLEETLELTGAKRMFDIWDFLSDSKHSMQGIQDRNSLPDARQDHPYEVGLSDSCR
jgi:hypothetical protein